MNRVLCLILLLFGTMAPMKTLASVEAVEPPAAAIPDGGEEKLIPGVALAQGITEITGVAISPLLGVSGVGAWQYFHTEARLRDQLPWYCQPWAWGTGMALLTLCLLKDTLGTAVPGVLKKPFDLIEMFENKASGLIASAAFVPLVAREMSQSLSPIEVTTGSVGLDLVAMIDLSWLVMPMALLAFAMVWVCSHAINVLIILSPFSLVDTALKLLRTGMLMLVGLSYWIAPWLGAALCVLIILAAAWFAPSALRLMIFGTRFAGDVVLPAWSGRRATPEQPQVFTFGRLGELPRRTGGYLELSADGRLEFCYRPFCVMPIKRVEMPEKERIVAKGLLAPAVLSGGERLLQLLPRYRGREQAIVEQLQFEGTREHIWARGWLALKGWWSLAATPKPRIGDTQ